MGNTKKKCPDCPLCGNDKGIPMPFFDRESGIMVCRDDGYHWRVCSVCGNGYPSIEPTLEDLQHYWNINRVEGVSAENDSLVWEQRLGYANAWASKTWDFTRQHIDVSGGRFLDIACGLGATVKKFQSEGWEALGIDADPNTRKFHEKVGITSVIGQFEGVETAGKFNLIGIAHAIYFLTQPSRFIQRVRESLVADGHFLVLLSDLTSVLSDGNPSQVHTWYPTTESLINTLELNGFSIVSVSRGRGSIFVLAKRGNTEKLSTSAWRSVLAHRSHHLRYQLVGRPLIKVVRMLRGMLKRA